MIEWIKAFGLNIWEWFTINKDSITAFFMSGQAISFVAAIVMLIKNLRGVTANTAATHKLDETLVNTNNMGASIVQLDNNFKALKKENDGLQEEIRRLKEDLTYQNSLITDRLNAILDVQTIVYSTIRDDTVRQTVNNILCNAKYSDKNVKDQMQNEIETLKHTFEEKLTQVNETMMNAVDKVSKNISSVDTAKERIQKTKHIPRG